MHFMKGAEALRENLKDNYERLPLLLTGDQAIAFSKDVAIPIITTVAVARFGLLSTMPAAQRAASMRVATSSGSRVAATVGGSGAFSSIRSYMARTMTPAPPISSASKFQMA